MTAALNFRTKNLFLAALSEQTYNRLKPHLEKVEMPLGKLVFEPFQPISHVYFPESCVISIVTMLENGSCVETGIIGCEGISGFEAILSSNSQAKEATSQMTGDSLRMKVEAFRAEFERGGDLQNFTLRYIHAFIAQISQNAACLLLHQIENRLARWLSMMRDRADGDEIYLTQEFIAIMLGVQRPSVSKAAAALQDRKLITYHRGHITVLDRPALKKVACECYETIKKATKQYLET